MALRSIPIRQPDPPPGGPTYEPERGGWYPPTPEPGPAPILAPTTQETMTR